MFSSLTASGQTIPHPQHLFSCPLVGLSRDIVCFLPHECRRVLTEQVSGFVGVVFICACKILAPCDTRVLYIFPLGRKASTLRMSSCNSYLLVHAHTFTEILTLRGFSFAVLWGVERPVHSEDRRASRRLVVPLSAAKRLIAFWTQLRAQLWH